MTAAAATKVPAIYGAIAAIQDEVGRIPKNGKADFGAGKAKYDYVKNDDILDAVRAKMVEQQVIAKPELSEFEYVTRDIGANRTLAVCRVRLVQTYISVVDGSEFAVTVYGEGGGADDKALRKAVTQAQKIANLLTFSIATGEPDPDGIESGPVSAASAVPAQTKAEGNIAKASADKLEQARTRVKAAAGKKQLAAADLNAMGSKIDPDFYNKTAALEALLVEINAIGGE